MSLRVAANSTFSRSVDSAGWALFLIWVGIALLWDVGWTWALIGTSVIILGVQLVLVFRSERVDMFMTAVGAVLLLGPLGEMVGSAWMLVPALMITIGMLMLVHAFGGERFKR